MKAKQDTKHEADKLGQGIKPFFSLYLSTVVSPIEQGLPLPWSAT